MFVLFNLPYAIRNTELAYLWVTHKALQCIGPDELFLIGERAYLDPARRAAVSEQWRAYVGLDVPSERALAACRCHHVDPSLLVPLEHELRGPNIVWRHLIREPYEPLVAEIEAGLAAARAIAPVEAILCWTNCASLDVAAQRAGIPVIYKELGPLRPPYYRFTAYFDRRGVNGNTEALARFTRFLAEHTAEALPMLSRHELLRLCIESGVEPPAFSESFDIGVPLQVENDSNLIAFGNGFSNWEIMELARRHWHAWQLLVRPHPACPISLQVFDSTTIDDSADAATFLSRASAVLTVNSSVALEAMLRGKPAYVMGESPLRPASSDLFSRSTPDDAWMTVWLNFFLFGYLVPFERLFDVDYMRWRMQDRTEREIYLSGFNRAQAGSGGAQALAAT